MPVCRPLIVVVALVLLAAAPLPAYALGPTLPSDMFTWEVETDTPNADGYYYLDLSANHPITGVRRSYLLTLNAAGEVVYFKKPSHDHIYSSWFPLPDAEGMAFSHGAPSTAFAWMFVDDGYTVVDSIARYSDDTPPRPLDTHELIVEEDGSRWILRKKRITYDMSQHVPFGDPEATLSGHVIEKWSAGGNLLWDWSSLDHLDRLDPAARIDSSQLGNSYVEHLHVNSVDFFPDGDLLVSSRKLSVVFCIDRLTGEVLWRWGGGPLNDFTFLNGMGYPHDLDFNLQHDARVQPGGTITLFDNGVFHTPDRSAAKEYELNEQTLEATLVFAYLPETSFTSIITGSHRVLENGHRLIGWGGFGNEYTATELDENGDVAWRLIADEDPHSLGQRPYAYRVLKAGTVGVATLPDVCEVVTDSTIELYANWFGHEDEVAGFRVYREETGKPVLMGRTGTGVFVVGLDELDETLIVRVRAEANGGQLISDFSEPREIFIPTSVPDLKDEAIQPATFTLSPASPNPFNGQTRVLLTVNQPGKLHVTLVNLLGRMVGVLHQGWLSPGHYPILVRGDRLSSGVFFVQAMDEHGQRQVRRITLLK